MDGSGGGGEEEGGGGCQVGASFNRRARARTLRACMRAALVSRWKIL